MTRFPKLLAGVAFGALVVGTTQPADALRCKRVRRIALAPDPGATLRLRGTAVLQNCAGVDVLHVVVNGSAPDGTPLITYVAARPYPARPVASDWFALMRRHGEVLTPGVSLGTLQGYPVVTVFDDTFTPQLTGNF